MTEPMGERGRQGAAPLGGHTPGPWHEMTEPPPPDEDPRGFNRQIVGPDYEDVFDIAGASTEDFRLVLAAPELLEALEATLDWNEVNSKGEYRAAVKRAHNAIAKVRGEQ